MRPSTHPQKVIAIGNQVVALSPNGPHNAKRNRVSDTATFMSPKKSFQTKSNPEFTLELTIHPKTGNTKE
jgi:hypothetical protein